MGVDELKKIDFKGFMAEEEALCLYELAKEAAFLGPCLEIGSYCGCSTSYLGMGCREAGGVLFSIDHHGGSEEQQPGQAYFDPELLDSSSGKIDTLPHFLRNIRLLGLEGTVIPILSHSEIVSRFWRTPLSLIFIDGGHTFAAAFGDYSGWVSNLLPGGFLVIHDIFFDSSKGGQAPRCIYSMALASGLFQELPITGTLGVLQRAKTGNPTASSIRRWKNLFS